MTVTSMCYSQWNWNITAHVCMHGMCVCMCTECHCCVWVCNECHGVLVCMGVYWMPWCFRLLWCVCTGECMSVLNPVCTEYHHAKDDKRIGIKRVLVPRTKDNVHSKCKMHCFIMKSLLCCRMTVSLLVLQGSNWSNHVEATASCTSGWIHWSAVSLPLHGPVQEESVVQNVVMHGS